MTEKDKEREERERMDGKKNKSKNKVWHRIGAREGHITQNELHLVTM